MKASPAFRKHFLRCGPGGALEFREALSRTTGSLADLFERDIDAPYSGLGLEQLERSLAAELRGAERGIDAAIGAAVDLVARHSIIVQHPLCVAHLHTPPALPALVAELVLATLNQSMDSWDQASAATHIEMQMVEWFAARFGLGPEADGSFTSGGTQSNFMGLLLARDAVCERESGHHVFADGLPDYAGRLRVLTSRTTHFSIVKSLAQLGLGSRAVIAVDCDDCGRMSIAALDAALSGLRGEGLIPMAVVGTAGTTDHGAIDPLDAIADLCEQHGTWLHVDAAFGGALILTGERGRLDGIARADSLALDFHKFFYQPISCGLFLLRDGEQFRHLEHHADYLNRESDPRPNLVEKSVATSRRFDALKIWMTLHAIGADELGAMFEHVLGLAREAASKIAAAPELELLAEPQLSTVLFRHRGGDDLNIRLHEKLLATGAAIIGRTADPEGGVVLKITLLNPCLSSADIDALLGVVLAAATD